MKKSIMLLVAILVSCAAFSQKGKTTAPKADTAQQVKYTCSMHQDVVSDKMGNCSKCGSKLIVDRRGSKQATTIYTCSMHPEEVSNKAGKCSKCGMELTEVKTKSKPKKG